MKTIAKLVGLSGLMALLVGVSGCGEAAARGGDASWAAQQAATHDDPVAETTSQALWWPGRPGPGVHHTYTFDGQRISYRVVGTGSTDIMLVHGWSVDSAVYDNLITELQSTDYRLIIPDLRGHGDSSKPPGGYTIDNYARDVLAVARGARAGRFVLVGHSMGGTVAQKVAILRPWRIRGLVLMSPVPASGFALPPASYNLFYNSATDPALQETVFNISSVALDPADLQHLLASAARVSPTAIQDSLDAWTGADFADQLDRVCSKTLVMVSDDPFLSQTFLQQKVVDPIGPNASLHHFGGAGHYLQVEKPGQTAAVIDNFVTQLHPDFRRFLQCRFGN